MPLAAPPQEVAAAFAALELPEAPEQRRDALAQFCARWLLPAGSDVLPAAVPQLASGPPPGWLPLVQDPEIRAWAAELHRIWGALVRQVRLGVWHAAAGAAAAAVARLLLALQELNLQFALLAAPSWRREPCYTAPTAPMCRRPPVQLCTPTGTPC